MLTPGDEIQKSPLQCILYWNGRAGRRGGDGGREGREDGPVQVVGQTK